MEHIYIWFVLTNAYYYEEMLEDAKGVIKNRKLKNDRQYNYQQKKDVRQTLFHKTLQKN